MTKSNFKHFNFKKLGTLGAASLLVLGLAGCAGDESGATNTGSTNVSDGAAVAEAPVNELTLVDGWTKATDTMTGVFGILQNPYEEDITLVNASSSAASMVELHETVVSGGNMNMQEIEGGFVIPAGGSYELAPGADHIMLMGLQRELLPGEQLDLELTFSDGTVKELLIEVRDFAGAIEEYAPGDHDEHGSHDEHSSHDHHDEHDEHESH